MVIYKITNQINGKPYIGQTRQPIEKRFLQHANAQTPLGNAIRDCGIENFTVEAIEECATPEQTREREMFWIRALKSKVPNGYNQSDGGESCFSKIRQKVAPKITHQIYSTGRMTIAESLKRFRHEFKLKQKDLAQALGISQQAYQVYEKQSAPSAKIILKLANTYDVSADYLLGRSDEPRPPKLDKNAINLIQALQSFQSAQTTEQAAV